MSRKDRALRRVLDKRKFEAQLLRDSFYDFVRRFWSTVDSAKPVWNWHIEVLCRELQEAAERVFAGLPKAHDVLVNVPPGSTKSLICSVMFPAWVWTRMPHAQTICASYAESLALDLSMKTRDIVESQKWKDLFGDIKLRQDQKAKTFFKNVHKGWRIAVGTLGTITGRHAHFIIVDDPLNPNQAVSEADRKTANRTVNETLYTRKVDKAVTLTVMVMQRLHQEDPAAVMLEKAKRKGGTPVRHVNLPAEVTGTGFDVVRPRRLAKFYRPDPDRPGMRLLDPVRISRQTLDEALVSLGPYGYAGQMLQIPVPEGGGMFDVGSLEVCDAAPNPADLVACVRFWDKAGTAGGGAFSAGVKVAEDRAGRFWILHCVRGQWASHERERVILNTARADGKKVRVGIEQEPGSGGKGDAEATIKNLRGFWVKAERPTGDKAVRARPFSVQWNVGNVRMVRGDWNQDFLDEARFFPNSKFKDQVDAAAGAFLQLTQGRTKVGPLFRRGADTEEARRGRVVAESRMRAIRAGR